MASDGTPRGSWASSIFDLKNSQADKTLPNLLERQLNDETDQFNTVQRQLNRQAAVFGVYGMQNEVRVPAIR